MSGLDMKCRVKVAEVLKELRVQREKHVEEHAKAMMGWRSVVRKEAQSLLDKGDKLTDFPTALSKYAHMVPQSFEKEILGAIAMFEATTDETVELTWDDFEKLIRGNWPWKREFHASNSPYTGRQDW